MHRHAHKLFGRFTYANVMSTFAVFLVLTGGAAYAANTVFSTDIVNGEVKTADLANEGVTAAKIATNGVYSADVRDDTLPNGGLTSADLAADSVTANEIAPGSVNFSQIAGGAVPAFVYTQSTSTAIDTTSVKEVTVACDDSFLSEVIGGGFVIAGVNGVNVPNVVVQRSYAVSATEWLVRAVVTSGIPNWQLTARANCVA